MTALVGREHARATLSRMPYYRWIYAHVLDAEDGAQIRRVMASHGLNTY